MGADKFRSSLKALGSRIDARSTRERLLICAAAAALAFMVIDSLLLGSALTVWKNNVRQRDEARAAIDRLQADSARRLVELTQQQRHQQTELANWRQRVRDGETQLQRFEATLVGPDQMLPVLDKLLASHGQVRLRSMTPLGRTDLLALSDDSGTPAPPMAAAGRAAAPARQSQGAVVEQVPVPDPNSARNSPSLYRHGVQLTVEGGFAELLAYVQALEAMPQRVLWGDVAFKVEQYPRASLTLQLYTISRDRHWLEI